MVAKLRHLPLVVYTKNHDDYVGGGIVAKHLASAGAKVEFTTVTGNDKFKDMLSGEMKKNKIKLNLIVDNNRPTTNKNTIIAGDYRLLSANMLDNRSIDKTTFEKIISFIRRGNNNSVILSDFRHAYLIKIRYHQYQIYFQENF